MIKDAEDALSVPRRWRSGKRAGVTNESEIPTQKCCFSLLLFWLPWCTLLLPRSVYMTWPRTASLLRISVKFDCQINSHSLKEIWGLFEFEKMLMFKKCSILSAIFFTDFDTIICNVVSILRLDMIMKWLEVFYIDVSFKAFWNRKRLHGGATFGKAKVSYRVFIIMFFFF